VCGYVGRIRSSGEADLYASPKKSLGDILEQEQFKGVGRELASLHANR